MNQQATRFSPRSRPTLEQVEQALSGAPGDADLLRRRAELRLDAGNRDGALADVRAALTQAGANPGPALLTVAARTALLFGRHAEA